MRRKGGLVGFIFFMVIITIFASGAVAVYTIFMKPEKQAKVPPLIGRTTVDAVAEAEKLGLVVQIEHVASTLPEGRVLAQSPQGGENLRKGQVIILQVSQSGSLHAVPDVKGKTLAKAQEEIKSQGFSLGDVIRINEPKTKSGIVIAQSPAAPANIAAGKKIDLLVQEGTAQSEGIIIPDVNRMTEAEARNILETGGVKIQAVERVYSPLLPEGLAIETKPGAGTSIKAGQGVTLKLATQRRPAGYMDSGESSKRIASNANVSATPKTVTEKQNTQTQTETPERKVTVSIGGEGDVFIGDDYEGSTTRTTSTRAQTSTTPAASTQTQQAQTPAASSSGGNKTARIRYIVPPIARPMDLRIEITDPSGKRNVMNKQVRSGESINTTAKYTQECVISIFLGGESVWQERQR